MDQALGQLERWRAQGADRVDPLRFGFIAALAARAQAQSGATRALLDARLAGLISAYRADVARARPGRAKAAQTVSVASPLVELLDTLRERAAARAMPVEADAVAQGAALPAASVFPELPALDQFQRLWEEVRAARQLRQSLEPAPTDAGPLNSHMLVHRALALMHDTAPGYLQHFLGYVDALSWMAQLQGEAEVESDAAPAPNGAKPVKRRVRKRPA